MERTDWLAAGFDRGQARFLMATAITHHRFSSPTWSDAEVRKLCTELADIEARLLSEIQPILPSGDACPSLGANPALSSLDD